MRLLITVLIIIFRFTVTFGQSETSQTEIIIIGTIHTGNKHFNHRTLIDVLQKVKPDIILLEQSKNFKPVFGLRTANFFRIWKPGIEQLALQKYSTYNKEIKILPFDTSFASRRQYKKEITLMNKAFFDRLDNIKMSFADSLIYANYAKKQHYYYDYISNADLIRINKPDIIEMTRVLYDLEHNNILSLAKKYLADSLLVKQFENDLIF